MGRFNKGKKKKHGKKKKRFKLEDLMDMAAERVQQKLDEREPTRDITKIVEKGFEHFSFISKYKFARMCC
jgi:hypothetical protein